MTKSSLFHKLFKGTGSSFCLFGRENKFEACVSVLDILLMLFQFLFVVSETNVGWTDPGRDTGEDDI